MDKGQPRTFKDEKEYMEAFIKYMNHCKRNKELPNIAGFCWYHKITRQNFYDQGVYYFDTHEIIHQGIENGALNHHNATIATLYLKNKFGYKDKQEVEQTNLNINTDAPNVEETKQALSNIIEKLKKNADKNGN